MSKIEMISLLEEKNRDTETRIMQVFNSSEKKRIMKKIENAFLLSDSVFHTEEYYNKVSKKAEFIVAIVDEEICGYCAFYANDNETKRAYVTTIAVSPAKQKCNLGRKLMNIAISISKENKMNSIKLEVRKENSNAIKFYKSLGFRCSDTTEESLYMEREI